MRLIDADALMIAIDSDVFNTESRRCYEKMRVRKQPTIDAEPVRHGRWMWVGQADGRTSILTCSACGGTEWASETSKYCPNCGAKMDLEVQDER